MRSDRNILKIRDLVFTFLVLGEFFFSYQEAHAQQKLHYKNIPVLDTHQCHRFRWQANLVVNSNPDNGLLFSLKSNKSNLYYWVTESGGLIAFSDSLHSKPLLSEKRNEYPFNPWEKGKLYQIFLPKRPDPNGWLRCQWRAVGANRVLDEIWICSPVDDCTWNFGGWSTTGRVFITEK